MENKNAIELIKIKGHIISSSILPQIFDEIVDAGGEFEIVEFTIKKTDIDKSIAKIKISADSYEVLDKILTNLQKLGVVPAKVEETFIFTHSKICKNYINGYCDKCCGCTNPDGFCQFQEYNPCPMYGICLIEIINKILNGKIKGRKIA